MPSKISQDYKLYRPRPWTSNSCATLHEALCHKETAMASSPQTLQRRVLMAVFHTECGARPKAASTTRLHKYHKHNLNVATKHLRLRLPMVHLLQPADHKL
jgi:hypothetical protein